MTKRMLIDASHAEEARVVLLDGSRIEDYDIEAAGRRQLKGNIYLAKVVRVEPSLQAAFIEYGGNRHGFLAFGEIHPDYYQIPVADRQRLLEMQEAEALEEEEEEERAAQRAARAGDGVGERASEEAGSPAELEQALQADLDGTREVMPDASRVAQAAAVATEMRVAPDEVREEFPPEPSDFTDGPDGAGPDEYAGEALGADLAPEAAEPVTTDAEPILPDAMPSAAEEILEGSLTGEVIPPPESGFSDRDGEDEAATGEADGDAPAEQAGDTRPAPELVGGEGDERRERRAPPRFLRNYKIQEVIRRRQILLVQVVKEERGTKGAALTTYISLAGRFSVLMPNSPRGGGVSRKITSAADRRRLKEVMTELGLPRGMGLIVRTAGANRPKAEIMRDCEYLLNQWDQIRDLTMRSIAPALIYEEANLIKRAMRDLYSREVEEVLVEGEHGWKAARDFMRMLMPDAARKVQLWREGQPLFTKANVEQQLDAMLAPTVQLRSGGYLVIDQAEALVAIDVNSGRSTRERGIEGTALRTNLEAAEEVARQLRLRDLAGLIVIDFIDMESRRHNTMVERRLKEALRNDRARIQVGSISHFGLLEMSRQRLRPSLTETNFVPCPHCGGLGHVRSVESCALHVLRTIEEEGARRRAAEILAHCAAEVALFLLNHKRPRLAEIEARFAMRVTFAADATMLGAQVRIDRIRTQQVLEAPVPVSQIAPEIVEDEEEPVAEVEVEAAPAPAATPAAAPDAAGDEADQRRRRRRRRGRSRGRAETDVVGPDETTEEAPAPVDAAGDTAPEEVESAEAEPVEALAEEPPMVDTVPAEPPAEVAAEPEPAPTPVAEEAAEDKGEEAARKRRGRRGGRRRRREDEPETPAPHVEVEAEAPVYAGPTPADPFGGAYDIFDALERAEEQRAAARLDATPEPAAEPLPEPAKADEAPTANDGALAQHAAADAPAEPALTPEAAHAVSLEPTQDDEPEEQPASPALGAPDLAPPDPADTEPVEPDPAIAPVLVGADDTPAVPKRGWWRR